MKLGPSLIGAVVGAAVGIASQVLLESTSKDEATWFAIVIGVLAGFGARALAGDAIRTASYVRAGLVAIIAFAGILGGTYASSVISRRTSLEEFNAPSPVNVENLIEESKEPSEEETPEEGGSGEGEEPAEEEPSEEASEEELSEEEPAEEQPSEDEPAEEGSEGEEPSEEQPAEEPGEEQPAEEPTAQELANVAPAADRSAIEKMKQMNDQADVAPTELPMWHVIFIALGTFLAYEISRGNTKKES